jgi:hypothetical protein
MCPDLSRRNEYQKLLHHWKFEKNRTNEDWKIVKRKVGARGAIHKKSALYLNRKLLPDQRVNKEFGRKALFMSAIEEFEVNQGEIVPTQMDLRKCLLTSLEPMPTTPPGFLICTPDAHDCHNYVFNNLPILSFIDLAKNFAGKIYTSSLAKIYVLTNSRFGLTIRLWGKQSCSPFLHTSYPEVPY